VLYAIATYHLDMAVVHFDRNLHRHFALGMYEHLPQRWSEIELVCRPLKVVSDRL
jgi:hypothetical protein